MSGITITVGGEIRISGSIELVPPPAPNPIAVRVTTTYGGFSTTTTGGTDMAYNLPSRMQLHVAVAYADADGHPATVDGDVTWTSSDDTIATVTADGAASALCAAVGLGTAQITASADADLGQGVRALLTVFDVTVVAGEAVAGTISPVGDPEPIP
jgi:Big-like domain-containing protein